MDQPGTSTVGGLRACAWRVPAAAFLWWCLTEGAGAWTFGSAAIVVAVAASLVLAPPAPGLRFSFPGFLRYAGTFVVRSVGAGLQVARLAFTPRLPLEPACVRVETTLPPGLPRVLLANTLTLQPGTLSVCLEGSTLELHVLDAKQPLEAELRALEGRIVAMLGSCR